MSAPRMMSVADVPETAAIKDGEVFTIAGVRLRSDGTVTTHCKPGLETRWIAKKEGRGGPLFIPIGVNLN